MSEWAPKHVTLPAFDVVGFTKIVTSGGEQLGAVRGDERWQQLRELGGADPTIYGIGSEDDACPAGHYRYTVGVKASEGPVREAGLEGQLFRIPVAASDWLVFPLGFGDGSFGRLWEDDPYRIVAGLGWEFNGAVGVHIDVYPPSYVADNYGFEFWMPVKRAS
jgi:hypothetical protein